MPAKPPAQPKDATQEQLEEYSKKLEQYFKEKEQELAQQQREADEAAAEVDRERTNIQLKEKEAEELREKNEVLQAKLAKDLEDLSLRQQSHEDVWREESAKLDTKRVELVEERKRLEKLAIELEAFRPEGGGRGDEEMVKFMKQQQELLTKITSLEEKREKRESDEAKRQELKDSIGRGVNPPIFRGEKGERPDAHILRAED